MKLSVTLSDERYEDVRGAYQPAKRVAYDRVRLVDMEAPAAVLAAALRGIADDIDPARDPYAHITAEINP